MFEILREHPRIFLPRVKEAQYFSSIPENIAGPGPISAQGNPKNFDEYKRLYANVEPGRLSGDISPDYLYHYRNAVPKILDEMNAQVPIIIILRNPVDRTYSNYLHHVRDGLEELGFEDALDAEVERRAANWAWGWNYAAIGLYARQVKAYLDNFDRVLILLFEEDIVTGRAAGKVLNFLDIEPMQTGMDKVHANVSGYPQNHVLHRLMTDELVVRKIKNLIKATPLYARSKRAYQKMMVANLRKEAMTPGTRLMLKQRFENDVALLEEYTELPVRKFWKDFR